MVTTVWQHRGNGRAAGTYIVQCADVAVCATVVGTHCLVVVGAHSKGWLGGYGVIIPYGNLWNCIAQHW